MKLVCLAFALVLIGGSCKLMKKDENKENTKSNSTGMTEFRALAWVHSTNIYEVNLRQYTHEGTFRAFEAHLPRLKDMGVQTLWFMPITPIAQLNKKGSLGSYYACSDYTAINPEFGDLNDFKHLVGEAHRMGFKVIIDWVANHTGWDHRWTKEHPEYFLKDSATNNFKIASGMDDIIELDYNNPALVQAMIDAMKFWVKECDIDGFRCDLASWVELPFWQKARPAVDAVKPLFWLGEFDELEHPDYGKVFDASYTWTWMHRTREFYQQHLPLSALDSILQRYSAIGDNSMRAWFTTNHDENSWNGTEYEKYGDMAPALAVFSATWNGVPLMYSGQELPLKDKRLEFFDKDTIPWTGKFELHDFYKTLFALHSGHPALRGGDASVQTLLIKTTDDGNILAYLRKKDDKEVLVLLNLSSNTSGFDIVDDRVKGSFRNVFSNSSVDQWKNVEMKPWEYLVFSR